VLLANGGVLVVGGVLYASVFDGMRPHRWDVLGIAICALGVVVIVHGRRRTR
jgi:small multidrug resistance family-3 protein